MSDPIRDVPFELGELTDRPSVRLASIENEEHRARISAQLRAREQTLAASSNTSDADALESLRHVIREIVEPLYEQMEILQRNLDDLRAEMQHEVGRPTSGRPVAPAHHRVPPFVVKKAAGKSGKGWRITGSMSTGVSRTFDTKHEAVRAATKLAARNHATVTIYDSTGSQPKIHDPRGGKPKPSSRQSSTERPAASRGSRKAKASRGARDPREPDA